MLVGSPHCGLDRPHSAAAHPSCSDGPLSGNGAAQGFLAVYSKVDIPALKLNLASLLVESGAGVDMPWRAGLAGCFAATGRREVRGLAQIAGAGIIATPTINTQCSSFDK